MMSVMVIEVKEVPAVCVVMAMVVVMGSNGVREVRHAG